MTLDWTVYVLFKTYSNLITYNSYEYLRILLFTAALALRSRGLVIGSREEKEKEEKEKEREREEEKNLQIAIRCDLFD